MDLISSKKGAKRVHFETGKIAWEKKITTGWKKCQIYLKIFTFPHKVRNKYLFSFLERSSSWNNIFDP